MRPHCTIREYFKLLSKLNVTCVTIVVVELYVNLIETCCSVNERRSQVMIRVRALRCGRDDELFTRVAIHDGAQWAHKLRISDGWSTFDVQINSVKNSTICVFGKTGRFCIIQRVFFLHFLVNYFMMVLHTNFIFNFFDKTYTILWNQNFLPLCTPAKPYITIVTEW